MRPALGGEKAVLSPQSSVDGYIKIFIYRFVAFCWLALISCASVGTKKIREHCISVAEMPQKKLCFAPKNLIYGILVANVAISQHTHFEDEIQDQVRF